MSAISLMRKPVHLNLVRPTITSCKQIMRFNKVSDGFDVSATVLDGATGQPESDGRKDPFFVGGNNPIEIATLHLGQQYAAPSTWLPSIVRRSMGSIRAPSKYSLQAGQIAIVEPSPVSLLASPGNSSRWGFGASEARP